MGRWFFFSLNVVLGREIHSTQGDQGDNRRNDIPEIRESFARVHGIPQAE
jgi:hypothetical protein